jgi:alpha-beta hydrolase superfamily lysophospholipase
MLLSYSGEQCYFLTACGVKLAAAGFGVFGIDYEGHGKSSGARCYIQKFDNLVADCDRFFKSVCGKKRSTQFPYNHVWNLVCRNDE